MARAPIDVKKVTATHFRSKRALSTRGETNGRENGHSHPLSGQAQSVFERSEGQPGRLGGEPPPSPQVPSGQRILGLPAERARGNSRHSRDSRRSRTHRPFAGFVEDY